MKKFVVFFVLPLFVSSCNKNISYGGKDLWQRQQPKDYDSSVFYQQNQNNNNDNYNNQGNNNNGYNQNNQSYNDNNNKQNNNSGNNAQPVNVYITNTEHRTQYDSNTGNKRLEDAINKAENGATIKSALLEQGQQSGQVDLTSREQFTNEKQKVKYSIEPKVEKQQQQVLKETQSKPLQEKQIMQEIKKETVKQIDNTSKGYKIQCGNYSSKASADAVAKKIREAGIENVKVVSEKGSNRILVGNFASKNDGAEIFAKINDLNLKDSIFWSYR